MRSFRTRLDRLTLAADRLPVPPPIVVVPDLTILSPWDRVWVEHAERCMVTPDAHDAFAAAELAPDADLDREAEARVRGAFTCSGLDPGAAPDDVLEWIGVLFDCMEHGRPVDDVPPGRRRQHLPALFPECLSASFAAFPIVSHYLRRGSDFRPDAPEFWKTDDPLACRVFPYVLGLEMLAAFDALRRQDLTLV